MATRHIVRLLVSTFAISLVRSQEWSYCGGTGPDRWSAQYPACSGEKQSPINIASRTTYIKKSRLSFINYDQPINGLFNVTNLGHQVQVSIPRGVKVTIDHDPLPITYTLAQFHFHWGCEDSFGSEHSLDSKFYPMEIHLVHYNSDFYPDFATAFNRTDGLAVLAVLVGVHEVANSPEIDALTRRFSEIPYKDDVTTMPSFSIRSLLPVSNVGFYRYVGSLTTPPCYEGVTWSVFTSQINVTLQQMNRFRTLLHSNLRGDPEQILANNFRPIQLLNGRIVLRNV